MTDALADPGDLPIVVLIGPTALGKTAVAVELATRIDAEIVVADSMQVYAGLPILTNQPDEQERRRAVHHLVGFVDPHDDYSVAAYAQAAQAVIEQIHARGRRVLIEGGSGLYVRAALGGLEFGGPPDPGLRRELECRLRREGLATLVAELRRQDPQATSLIDTANPRRVLRALERLQAAERLSEAQRDQLWAPAADRPCRVVGLHDDRDLIRHRVDARVVAMIEAGAVDELRGVLRSGPPSRTLSQAIGVQELSAYDRGECTLQQAMTRMQARTRRLVRRQLTWMRKLPLAARIAVRGRSPVAIADEIVAEVTAGEQLSGP